MPSSDPSGRNDRPIRLSSMHRSPLPAALPATGLRVAWATSDGRTSQGSCTQLTGGVTRDPAGLRARARVPAVARVLCGWAGLAATCLVIGMALGPLAGAARSQSDGSGSGGEVTLLLTPSGWVVQGQDATRTSPHQPLGPHAGPAAPATGAAHQRNWMTTPTARSGDWMSRHEQFVALARRGGVRLLFLGDSITDGWRGTGLKTWNAYFAPLHAANFGISGDGTQNVLWRIEHGELDGIQPGVTVLLIGTNDIPWTAQPQAIDGIAAQVADAVSAVVDAIRAKLPSTKLLLLGVFPRGEKPNPSRDIIVRVNQRLAALASGEALRYLDIGSIFMDGDTIPRSIMPDSLHPNAEGYTRWAKAMAPTVWKMLAGF